jgi:hypothetical protein
LLISTVNFLVFAIPIFFINPCRKTTGFLSLGMNGRPKKRPFGMALVGQKT